MKNYIDYNDCYQHIPFNGVYELVQFVWLITKQEKAMGCMNTVLLMQSAINLIRKD